MKSGQRERKGWTQINCFLLAWPNTVFEKNAENNLKGGSKNVKKTDPLF